MAFLLCIFFASILSISTSSSPLPPTNASVQDPQQVVQQVLRSIDMSRHRRMLSGCRTGNPMDDCWRCDPDWANNRQRLADCAIGFGRNALGGRNGKIYVVTDAGDDPANPAPGTLRYGIIQDEPLWIVFDHDMTIRPTQELRVNSYKTVDGRGANVVVGEGGACFAVHFTSNVIIHGVTIRNCKPEGHAGDVSDIVQPVWSDGDGVSVRGSSNVWIDHCTLEECTDGLIDVTHASTGVTLSNNLMTNHDKVMLLGHSDDFPDDKNMQVTVAFNHFGQGLIQRMPRCRFGFFHVFNNDYTGWGMYAVGGSSSPTILSQANRFLAPDDAEHKEVTKRQDAAESEWSNWNWRSEGDMMLNGAFFTPSGETSPTAYSKAPAIARAASLVATVTSCAGALSCSNGSVC